MGDTYYGPGFEPGHYDNSDSFESGYDSGGSGSDFWDNNGAQIIGFGTNLINGFLTFGASIYASKHQTTPTYPDKPSGGGGFDFGGGGGNNQPQGTNWLLLVIVVFVILAILFGIFLLARNKGGNA